MYIVIVSSRYMGHSKETIRGVYNDLDMAKSATVSLVIADNSLRGTVLGIPVEMVVDAPREVITYRWSDEFDGVIIEGDPRYIKETIT